MTDKSFTAKNIKGTGIAVGHHASANVSIGQSEAAELTTLLAGIYGDLEKIPLPDDLKAGIRERALEPMQQAASEGGEPSTIERGLTRLNDNLQDAGAAAENLHDLAHTAKRIAGVVGVTLSTVAPFLAKIVS